MAGLDLAFDGIDPVLFADVRQQPRQGAQPKTDRVFTMEATAAVLRVGSRVALIQIDHTEMLGGIPAAIITAAAERVR